MDGGVAGIIDYWGDHGKFMQPFAGPGKGWHDPDMLMVGAVWKGFDPHDNRSTGERCLTPDGTRTSDPPMLVVSRSAQELPGRKELPGRSI